MSRMRASVAGLCARLTMYATCRTRGIFARGGFLAGDRHPRRVLQMPSRNRQNPRRHRRREQRRLACRRGRFQDRVEVLGESHVEHLVGLVENQHAQAVELQCLAAHVIQRATRRGHHDVGAALRARRSAGASARRRKAAARSGRRLSRTCGPPRRPASRARASARARGRRSGADPVGLDQSAAASAARTPRSCRSRFRPARAGRGPRAAAGSSRAEPVWAPRIRAPNHVGELGAQAEHDKAD